MAFDDGGACSGGIYCRPNWMHTKRRKFPIFRAPSNPDAKQTLVLPIYSFNFSPFACWPQRRRKFMDLKRNVRIARNHHEESWLGGCFLSTKNAKWIVARILDCIVQVDVTTVKLWPPFICCIGKNGIGNDNFCNSSLFRNDREREREGREGRGGRSKLNHGVLASQFQKPNELCIRVQSLFPPLPIINRSRIRYASYVRRICRKRDNNNECIRELWTTERNRRRK